MSPRQNMKQKEDKAIAGMMEWHGRSNGQEAYGRKKGEYGLGKKMMTFTQVMPSTKKRWKTENMSPKAHMSFTPQELNTHQNVQQNQTNTKATTKAWRLEKEQIQMEVEHTHRAQVPPICIQPI